mmetsp:Transcript_30650/g.55773  ORF Transcript_30650/g.55773 Transcript_30650/m.55773 type:complete len:292 (+) Transcript_30650:167-1042(+)
MIFVPPEEFMAVSHLSRLRLCDKVGLTAEMHESICFDDSRFNIFANWEWTLDVFIEELIYFLRTLNLVLNDATLSDLNQAKCPSDIYKISTDPALCKIKPFVSAHPIMMTFPVMLKALSVSGDSEEVRHLCLAALEQIAVAPWFSDLEDDLCDCFAATYVPRRPEAGASIEEEDYLVVWNLAVSAWVQSQGTRAAAKAEARARILAAALAQAEARATAEAHDSATALATATGTVHVHIPEGQPARAKQQSPEQRLAVAKAEAQAHVKEDAHVQVETAAAAEAKARAAVRMQ